MKNNSRCPSLVLNGELSTQDLSTFAFHRENFSNVEISEELKKKIALSHQVLIDMLNKGTPIYGVSTGFGDSCTRYVNESHSSGLQENLIQYLSCGQGDFIPLEASRAMFLIRLNSLVQGISGVSVDLIDQMCTLLNYDILPVVPCEGSLGASGDLVPLAYLGQTIQGYGQCWHKGKIQDTQNVFQEYNIQSYKLKPKEGLAIVNGTSTMAAMMLYNLKQTDYLIELLETATAWQCMVLKGKRESFGPFINGIAKKNHGQKNSASRISQLLDAENYFPARGQEVQVSENGRTNGFVQDRYSLRCAPQIFGPIIENLEISWQNLHHEINSVTDNPVVDIEGRLEMGGNFYGGYLCQAMDFIKINLAHLADLADRQLMMLMDEKSNQGLSTNLIDTQNIPVEEQHIHHGLKGVHQTVSAITSEVLQKSIPSGIFSRSSESHNQDKVSLGMSAAMTCASMLQGVYKITSMHLVCLAQAIEIRKIKLQGEQSKKLFSTIRSFVPFISKDTSLGLPIANLYKSLQGEALKK